MKNYGVQLDNLCQASAPNESPTALLLLSCTAATSVTVGANRRQQQATHRHAAAVTARQVRRALSSGFNVAR